MNEQSVLLTHVICDLLNQPGMAADDELVHFAACFDTISWTAEDGVDAEAFNSAMASMSEAAESASIDLAELKDFVKIAKPLTGEPTLYTILKAKAKVDALIRANDAALAAKTSTEWIEHHIDQDGFIGFLEHETKTVLSLSTLATPDDSGSQTELWWGDDVYMVSEFIIKESSTTIVTQLDGRQARLTALYR